MTILEIEINGNLKPCDCFRQHVVGMQHLHAHADDCAGRSTRIPCPVPRMVEMTVRLGECTVACSTRLRDDAGRIRHRDDCPARPIRVSCSIGGDGTWAGSEVVESDVFRDQNIVGPLVLPSQMVGIEATCRERWELVKAVVLGNPLGRRGADSVDAGITIIELFEQRNAVFAALADMAQMDEAHLAKRKALAETLKAADTTYDEDEVESFLSWYGIDDTTANNAERALATYVEMLIEQVGTL